MDSSANIYRFYSHAGSMEKAIPCEVATRPLCNLQCGECGVVEAFAGEHPEFTHLQAMGFRVGELVTMLMPGCSCAVALGPMRLIVSRELLGSVYVTPLD